MTTTLSPHPDDRPDHVPDPRPRHRPELPRARHRRAAAHRDAAAGHPAVRRRPDRLLRLRRPGGRRAEHRWRPRRTAGGRRRGPVRATAGAARRDPAPGARHHRVPGAVRTGVAARDPRPRRPHRCRQPAGRGDGRAAAGRPPRDAAATGTRSPRPRWPTRARSTSRPSWPARCWSARSPRSPRRPSACVLALLVAVVGQGGFALHPSALPGRGAGRPAPEGHASVPLPWGHLAGLMVAMAAVGLVFGASQTGVAARLDGLGRDELTGPVYALMGVGSAVAGLLTTRLPRQLRPGRPDRRRRRRAGAGRACCWPRPTAPLALAGACLVAGVALAPALISSLLAGRAGRPARLGHHDDDHAVDRQRRRRRRRRRDRGPAGRPGLPRPAGLLVVSAAGVLVLAGGVAAWLVPHHVE